MRRNWIAVLCLSLLIVFVTSLAQAQSNSGKSSESEQAKQVTCTGKVVDAQDKPIAYAKVTLYEIVRDETTYVYVLKLTGQTTTDANGAFSLAESLEGDNFPYGYIVAEKKGMILGFDNWRMRDGNKKLQIKQSQTKGLAGIVVDENDKPVSDVQVSISILKIVEGEEVRGLAGQVATKYFTLTTNSAGKFKFTGIPAEATAEFIVKKNGRATVNTYRRTEMAGQKLKFTPGQTDIKLVLPLEAKIEGIVVEKSSGTPVSGVKVRVMSQQDPPYFRLKPLVSKEDGTFSIGALASRRYTVELVPSREGLADWVAEPVEVITEAGKTKNDVKVELSKGGVLEVVFKVIKHQIQLDRHPSVSGIVRDKNGQPVAAVAVASKPVCEQAVRTERNHCSHCPNISQSTALAVFMEGILLASVQVTGSRLRSLTPPTLRLSVVSRCGVKRPYVRCC